jgi:nicotinate-nucleotide adenylyltransferase
MVKLAVGRRPGMAVSAIEMRRPGPSYTIDTVRAFRRRFPGRPLYFIVGADTVQDIPNWHRWRDLIRTVRFVAVSRPGFTLASLPGYADRFLLLPCRGYRVSSAGLRTRLVRGGRAPELPPKVAAYIKRHRLYRPDQGTAA